MTVSVNAVVSAAASRAAPRRCRIGVAALLTALTVVGQGCASLGGAGVDRSTELQRLAHSVMTDDGNVQVRYEAGTAFVFGNVKSAPDQGAIVRAIAAEPDVDEVREVLNREM